MRRVLDERAERVERAGYVAAEQPGGHGQYRQVRGAGGDVLDQRGVPRGEGGVDRVGQQ
ncbi:hypothetical protein [Streptomyces sp. NPDC051577]|uniref:hypothetical protein n=1 Tax=Streptomyces sp. NPDC051577 TaxID=3155166 RepID=UPI00343711CA